MLQHSVIVSEFGLGSAPVTSLAYSGSDISHVRFPISVLTTSKTAIPF